MLTPLAFLIGKTWTLGVEHWHSAALRSLSLSLSPQWLIAAFTNKDEVNPELPALQLLGPH